MKRFLTMALVGVVALGLASTAYANLCSNDVVPAATLLFPFVQYDYDAGLVGNSGATTLFAITNVSSEAQIVHITVWTDYSIAILDFNIVLTGYDVQTMSIRDILRDGLLPFEEGAELATGDIGEANIWAEDNQGEIPVDLGPFSSNNQLYGSALDGWFNAVGLPEPQPTSDGSTGIGAYLDCDPAVWEASPNWYAENLPIDGGTLANFRNFLEASMMADTWYADCTVDPTVADPDEVIPAGDFDPNLPTPWWIAGYMHPAWMYITADVVGACNKDLPDGDAASYFGATSGVTYRNVLMGDVMWLDPADEPGGINFSEADNAVHVEAGEDLGGSGCLPAVRA